MICDDLWPRRVQHYVLYSTRHTFAAAAKIIFARAEVAALMGHAVDDTATKHYSRPPKGSKRLPAIELPRPSVRDLARVRRTDLGDYLAGTPLSTCPSRR